jgi:hypothetical protein
MRNVKAKTLFTNKKKKLAKNIATVLGSIPASSDTVESEGAADEAVLNTVHRKKIQKIPLLIKSPC